MKKLLVLSVMMTMVVWTMGAAFVPGASAATLTAGDLIKASGPAVYYYAADGQRYTFPTESTYKTWYADFSSVKTITDDELAAITLAGNVVVRAGTKLVKIATVPKVFAVEPNGQLVWVKTEAAAKALYGDNWGAMIVTIPDGFWTNYTDSGTELDGMTYPEGTLVKYATGSDTYYVNADGTWSKIATEAAFSGNMFNWNFVVTAPATITMTAGSDITGAVAANIDVSQGGGGGSTVLPTGSGTLTIALAGDTPAASPVALSSTANFTKFSLTATGSAVSVTKLTVTKGGYSSTADVENIKITDLSGIALTNSASLNSSGTAGLSFNPSLDLAAGETRYLYIRSGITSGSAAGRTVSYAVNASSDVTSTAASVAGNYPVQGNAMNVVNVTIGTANVYTDGTVTDTTPDAGDENVVVNRFRVEAGTTEAITIESLSLLEAGSAGLSDVKNIELWSVTEGKTLGTVEAYGPTGKANFTGLNLVVGKGDIYRFEVRIDIVSGASLTVNTDLVDGSDVLMSVKGNSYGFYITASDAASWGGQGAANQTINAGALAISKSATTPATGNITEAADQELAVFDFEAKGEDVRVSALSFSVATGSNAAGNELLSCKLYDEAMTLVAGPVDGTGDDTATGTIAFTDTFTVPVGTGAYSLKCRVFDADSNNFESSSIFSWTVSVVPSTGVTAKGVSTNDSITASPTSSVSGNTQTLKAVTLSALSLGTPAAQSVAINTDDFIWTTFSLDASNSGEDVNVTAVIIEDTFLDTSANSLGGFANIDNAEIWCDVDSSSSARGDAYEKKVSDTEQPTGALGTSGDYTQSFSFLEALKITKNSFVKCAMVADLGSGADAGDQHRISLDQASGAVTATGDATGSTVTITPTGAGQLMTVASTGTVTLSQDATNPKASILVGGDTMQTLSVIRLTADSVEDVDLDALMITDGGSDSIVSTYYFYSNKRADGGSVSDPIASKPGAATAQVFIADGTVTIPASGYVLITVKGDINLVDGTTIDNGDTVEIEVATSGDFDVTGLSSGSAITISETITTGAVAHSVYEARPVVTKDASSPSGTLGTGTQTLVAVFKLDNSDGLQEIVMSSAGGSDMEFNLSGYSSGATTCGACNVVFKDKSGDILGTATSVDLTGLVAVTNANLDFATNSLTIAAGDYELIKVYADTSDFITAGNSLQVWLDDATAADFTWSINSAAGGTGTDEYETADVSWRGDIYANQLGK